MSMRASCFWKRTAPTIRRRTRSCARRIFAPACAWWGNRCSIAATTPIGRRWFWKWSSLDERRRIVPVLLRELLGLIDHDPPAVVDADAVAEKRALGRTLGGGAVERVF